MTALSGGQAARVALAALLLSRFDVVLLDEPTNDLDLDGLARLEAFVQGLRGGVVLVSHDREFLARCVTRIVELDLAQGQVTVYDGGYDAFLEERAVARRHAREAYEQYAGTRADLVQRARTQREWSSQGVRNAMKKSPDNDKIRRKAATESSEKQAQKVRQMESRIARLDEVEEPRKEWVLQFDIAAAPRSSGGGRHPQRGHAATGRLPSSARSPRRSTPATGSASPVPTVPARRRCCDCCSATPPPTPARRRWAPRSRSGSSTRPAPASTTPCRSATPSRRSCRS